MQPPEDTHQGTWVQSRDLRQRRGPFAGRLPLATAIPLSRRRPIELFLFRHGAPFRASEQQAYSRPVFLANSGNLGEKRLKSPTLKWRIGRSFSPVFRTGAGISGAKDGRL